MKAVVVKVCLFCSRITFFLIMFSQMIKAGVPVFFGCDVGKFSDQGTGIMDPALFEYGVTGILACQLA